jgi:hypothetical protein
MKRIETRRGRRTAAALLSIALIAAARLAGAQDGSQGTREAVKHFERGVALYGETDYRASLVEFKRAYAIAPNVAVLYNMGQAQYQLQDYAAALNTFTRYLAESSSTDVHRQEVEGALDVLRARVGHLTVVTAPPGADVSVDDLFVGRTPLEDRVLVSVGPRKITATLAGRPPVTRTVDVAAEDNVSVTLDLPEASGDRTRAVTALDSAASPESPNQPHGGATWRTVGWVATGTLAAGAGASGILALIESSRLKSARASFPASAQELSHDSNLTLGYSIAADALTVAAIAVGGITLFSTLSASKDSARHAASATFVLAPGSAHLALTF